MELRLEADQLILLGAVLLAVGAVASGVAQRVRFPTMLAFLGTGMLVGSDGLELVPFDDTQLAQTMAIIALVVILFDGGLSTSWSDLRRVLVPASVLATFGVMVTGAVVAGVAYAVLDVSTTTALLIGAVVSSTDAAAVFSAVRGQPIDRRVVQTLEAESGLNDPMAALLTVGLLATWSGDPGAEDWLWFGVVQVVGGLAVGGAVGWLGAAALRRTTFSSAGIYPVVGLAAAGLAYGLAASFGASGLLATFVCGVLVASLAPRRRATVVLVSDSLATSAQMVLFAMLGLLVYPSELLDVAGPALLIAVTLVVVARPLAVVVSVAWLGYRPAQLGLVAWAGLRGAVPIVLATFVLTADHPDGDLLFNVVFFVVVVSTLAQSLTVRLVARRLGLLDTSPAPSALASVLPIDELATDLIELELRPNAVVVGRSLVDVPLPGEARIAVIVRGKQSLIPHGNTVLCGGDVLVVAAPGDRSDETTDALVRWSAGSPNTPDTPDTPDTTRTGADG